jgi:hypothetical protein
MIDDCDTLKAAIERFIAEEGWPASCVGPLLEQAMAVMNAPPGERHAVRVSLKSALDSDSATFPFFEEVPT